MESRDKTRIKGIYLYLKKKGIAIKTQELADEFGYTIRTIQRDLKTLEFNHFVENLGGGKWMAAKG